jgi:WD40 repeat protein
VSLTFSPDGAVLASGHLSYTVRLWDTRTGRLLRTLSTHGDSVGSLAFSPDGKMLAVGTDYQELVELWDVQRGKMKRRLVGHSNEIRSVAFSPNGRVLASASADGTVKLWYLRTGELLVTLLVLPPAQPGQPSTDWIAFTPDGYYFGSAGAGRFIRWQLGQALLPAAAYEGVFRRPDRVEQTLMAR